MSNGINYDSINKFNENLIYLAQEYPKIWCELSNKLAKDTSHSYFPSELLVNFWSSLKDNPDTVVNFNSAWNSNHLNIIKNITEKMNGNETDDIYSPSQKDLRFKDEAWTKNSYFAYLKQAYLMTCQLTEDLILSNHGCNELSKKTTLFFNRQMMNAFSPSNFIFTNPTILNEIVNSKAQNLVEGIQRMYSDLSSNNLKITNVDLKAFEIGKNIAITPGKVILRDELFELIAYYPKQEKLTTYPILLIPPLINKYYILDLQEKNSLTKWLVDNGQAVFTISWKNVNEEHRNFGVNDYIEQLESAVNAILKLTKVQKVATLSYCIGGTLNALLSSYLSAKGKDIISSSTFIATLIDFADTGDLNIFVNDAVIERLSEKIEKQGYLDGAEMNNAFNLLRSNDMIWSNIVNHYLLGKEPLAFDILFWNADNTRIPAKFYNYYLKEIFLKNNLIKKDGLTIRNQPIDLGRIDYPCYFLSAKDDHIVPWHSAYMGMQAFNNTDKRFVLTEAGHVAGVINPPDKGKYGFYSSNRLNASSTKWLEKAKFQQTSWWVDWLGWHKKVSKSDTYVLPNKKIDDISIIDAPGTYVHQK